MRLMNLGEKIVLFGAIVLAAVLLNHFGPAQSSSPRLVTQRYENLRNEPSRTRPVPEAPFFVFPSPVALVHDVFQKPDSLLRTKTLPHLEPPVVEKKSSPQTVASLPPSAPSPAVLTPPTSIEPSVFHPSTVLKDPVIQARAALIADIQTGETYFTLAQNERWPIASITKLMTARIAMQSLDRSLVTTLTEADLPKEDNSVKKRLGAGETYAIGDLFKAMLVVSSNEAAETLANRIGKEQFLIRMNAQADGWGLHDTYFSDATGLSTANQSTANDLKELARKLFEVDPEIFEITREPQVSITELGTKKAETLVNINQFAKSPWFLGGKTGYTDAAQGNLLTIARLHGRPVVTIVLGAEDRFAETKKLIDWFDRNYDLVQPTSGAKP